MALLEMSNMGVGKQALQPIHAEINTLTPEITTAADAYAATVKAAGKAIAQLMATPQAQIEYQIESPIDYNKSVIKKLPLSSDSLQMDVQYFPFEKNAPNGQEYAMRIGTHIAAQISISFGADRGAEMASTAKQAVSAQLANHALKGTLIFTVNCTHRLVDMFAPLVFDVDKAFASWNALYKDDPMNTFTLQAMREISEDTQADSKALHILSGATYGSAFVEMLFVLQQDDTNIYPAIISLAGGLQAKMQTGGWIVSEADEYGVGIAMLRPDDRKAAIDSVGKRDQPPNQVIDMNSLIVNLDHFIQQVMTGAAGVPIHFFVKPLTKRELAKAWIEKHYPFPVFRDDDITRIVGIGSKIAALLSVTCPATRWLRGLWAYLRSWVSSSLRNGA